MGIPVIETYESTLSGGNTANLTLTKPSGVAVGDLLILLCMNENNSADEGFSAITSESGWTQEFNLGDATSDNYIALYWRIADGGEDATVDVPLVTSMSAAGWYVRISGAAAAPINIVGTWSARYAQPIDCLTITTDEADCLAFAFWGFDGGDYGTFSLSGSGWATTAEYELSEGGSSGVGGGFRTKAMASAGATNTVAVDASGAADAMGGVQFAIEGAAGGAVTPKGLFMLISQLWWMLPVVGLIRNNDMKRRELWNPLKWIKGE